ncbi:MAG: hypothetical protein Q6365_023280 [Candidatus Sigynarchaeota archaeon]
MPVTSRLDTMDHALAPNIVFPWDTCIIVASNAVFISIVIIMIAKKHSRKMTPFLFAKWCMKNGDR